MSVDEYMKKSLEMQARQVALLEAIAASLGGKSEVLIRVPEETFVEAAKQAAAETKKTTEQAAVEADAIVAANRAKEAAEKAEAGKTAESPVLKQAAAEVAAEADKKPPTAEDVRSALMALGRRKNSEAAVQLLKKYGATSVSTLSVDDYATLIAESQS